MPTYKSRSALHILRKAGLGAPSTEVARWSHPDVQAEQSGPDFEEPGKQVSRVLLPVFEA